MYDEGEISEVTEFLRPFPDPGAVFSGDVEKAARLSPIGSGFESMKMIDMSSLAIGSTSSQKGRATDLTMIPGSPRTRRSSTRVLSRHAPVFLNHGVLVRQNYPAPLEEVLEYQTAYVEQWGMALTAGNWAYPEDFPIVLLPDAEMPEEAYPLTEDG